MKILTSSLVLASLLLLTGCLEDKPKAECFEMYNQNQAYPKLPMLLNKCTGETWILLRETYPPGKGESQGTAVYKWFRVNQTILENAVNN